MDIIVTILFSLMIVFIVYKFMKEKSYSKEPSLGYISSMIGVLGTFIGISIGLWEFDTNNITESVPMLLVGMKIAFATSIAGMIGAIFMKYIAIKNEDEENIDDIIDLFNTMIKESRLVNETLIANQTQSNDVLNKVSESWIISQREFTQNLASELHSLNINTTEKQDELISEFKKLGETFTELNKCVDSLVQWQENYKDTIELTTNELNKVIESITNVDESIKEIANNSTLISNNNENLSDILKDIEYSQGMLLEGSKSIVEISDKANQSIPMINTYFEKSNELFKQEVAEYMNEFKMIVYSLKNCVPEVNNSLLKSTKRFNNSLESFVNNIENSVEDNNASVKNQIEVLKKYTVRVNNNLENTISESTKRLENITRATSNQIKIMNEDMEKIFTRKIDQLDELLEVELTKTLNSLGRQLTTISKKFANDYTPLANELKEVVEIAKGVKSV